MFSHGLRFIVPFSPRPGPDRVRLTKEGDLAFFEKQEETKKTKPKSYGSYQRQPTQKQVYRRIASKSAASDKTVKQLLGELYGDKVYLEKLLEETGELKERQAANLAGFRASEDPRFEAGIPDFMNGFLNFSIHFNVVHRKVDWRNPKMKSLNSMPER